MGHVFISYKREDIDRVAPLVEALRGAGVDVWWDQDIPPGGSWRETIVEKLDGCALCVAIWSDHSIGPAGRFVREEAERSTRRGAYLGVLIDPVPPPFGFSEWQAIDLSTWLGDAGDPQLTYLVETIKARLSGAPPPAPDVAATRRATRKQKSNLPLLIGGGAAIAAAGAALLWFAPWSANATQSPTEFVNRELAQIDCTWAQISAVPAGDSGMPMQLSGVASGPPVVRDFLVQKANAQGVSLADVDVRDVAAAPQAVCPQLNTLRPYRVPNSDRFKVVSDRRSVERSERGLTGLVEVQFDLNRLPGNVALLGLDDHSGLEVLIPDVRAHPGRRGSRPNRPVLDLVFDDRGRNVRNVGLLLVSADTPIDLSAVQSANLEDGQPDSQDALRRLGQAAAAGRWQVELGLVRCGFEAGPDQSC